MRKDEPMLRSLPPLGTLRKRVIAITLAGLLMIPLAACSARDEAPSDPSVGPAGAAIDRSEETREPVEVGVGSLIERGLAAMQGRPSRASTAAWDDGYIPDGATVSPFEVDHPALANLDTALLRAIQRAASDARHDGIDIRISSGWRSAAYQQLLLDDAVRRYGSEEARQFVNTPEQSTHVTGRAVDVAPMDAMGWLSQHGSVYGLCQTYANELWHYELMTEPGGMCPPQLTDASAG
jgi:hypothetical protein